MIKYKKAHCDECEVQLTETKRAYSLAGKIVCGECRAILKKALYVRSPRGDVAGRMNKYSKGTSVLLKLWWLILLTCVVGIPLGAVFGGHPAAALLAIPAAIASYTAIVQQRAAREIFDSKLVVSEQGGDV